MKRDGQNISLWQTTPISDFSSSSKLSEDAEVFDAIIVGAGITGVTAGYELAKKGKKVLIAEAQNPAFGTTGGTTAHINNFYDTTYAEVINDFGLEEAKLFAEAAAEAMDTIENNISANQIECEFRHRTAFLFATNEEQNKMLEDIVESAEKVGVKMDYINDTPFPIPYTRIAQIENNAQFNPVSYINGLLENFKNNGGILKENCMVTGVDESDVITVKTSLGDFKCKSLFYATHIPPGVNLMHFENQAYRSYALAIKLEDENYPEALGYDLCEPYHYYRTQEINGEKYFIAGGEDHKTGEQINTEACFKHLETYLRQFFQIKEVSFKWSSQYYVPADGLPYIGHLPQAGPNIYAATGYNGNGMMLGTIAGKIVSDQICEIENKYTDLFDPKRIKPIAGFKEIMRNAADTVGNYLGIKIDKEKISEFAAIAPGEGKLVEFEGRKTGIYKSAEGNIHMVSPSCTHVHCTVCFNATERSWDCPCHGARYDINGNVLTAPARKGLEKLS